MSHLSRFTTVLGTLILVVSCISIGCSKIDYSHDIIGTGTVMTDYRMGYPQTSEAIGVVRGTGDIVDKYYFTTNNSSEIKVEDRFILAKTDKKAVSMSVEPNFPPWPGEHGSYKLIGKSWAKNIQIDSTSTRKSIAISASS